MKEAGLIFFVFSALGAVVSAIALFGKIGNKAQKEGLQPSDFFSGQAKIYSFTFLAMLLANLISFAVLQF